MCAQFEEAFGQQWLKSPDKLDKALDKREFTVPIAGLKDKVYHFEYELEESFFETAEESLVDDPDIRVDLKFDKTNDPYVLDFEISGSYYGECDRCASRINIPVASNYRLFVEFGEHIEGTDETEVIYIDRDAHEIELYDHIHDYALLSIPMVKRCESEEDLKRCDEKVEQFLQKINTGTEETDPRWEALKKLKK